MPTLGGGGWERLHPCTTSGPPLRTYGRVRGMSTPGFSRTDLAGSGRVVSSLSTAVRFQDVDAAGTVYFARVFEYFGNAYTNLLEERGIDLPALIANGSVVAPLVHAEADYLSPLRFGDPIDVEVVETLVQSSSIVLGYRIRSGARVCAVGHTVHVFVDRDSFAKCAVPESFRAALSG
jgi:1,4-dihydroxy-2-naphthoyl-CoA hydrolase